LAQNKHHETVGVRVLGCIARAISRWDFTN
jgi:hypothetical protein